MALIPAIGYIRVSLAREEMISPDIQRSAITDWAARTGREVTDWVVDLDMTGRNFKRRVMGIIERIERREIADVAVWRYDRWGRNAAESLANIRRVELAGGQLHSATEPIDAETTIGRYTRTNALALAEMQSDIIGDNWRAAHANRRGRGLTATGTPRFGYVRVGRVYDPDPTTLRRWRRDIADPQERYEPNYAGGTADVLVEMYSRYLAGEGADVIMAWLNEAGVRNAQGRIWNKVTVMDTLDSGFGAGLICHHDCRCRRYRQCGNKTWIPGAHEAVIEPATWEQYQQTRRSRAVMAPRARYSPYPLSTLMVCGLCHGAMTIYSGGSPRQIGYGYRCSRRITNGSCDGLNIQRSRVEEFVLAQLQEWASDITGQATAPQRTPAPVVTLESLTRELAAKDRELKQLVRDRVRDGGRTPAEIWDEARDDLLAERAELEQRIAQLDEPRPEQAAFVPVIVSLIVGWEIMAGVERREVLGQLVRHVTVTPLGPGRRGLKRACDIVVSPAWEPCDCPRCG